MARSQQYTLEFDFKRTPAALLWNYIATPSGLEKWFADKVTQDGKEVAFAWHGNESRAQIGTNRAMTCVKYKWIEPNELGENTTIEMRIAISELTKTTTLTITDYVAFASELDEARDLWEHQIETLKRVIGCL